MHKSFILAKCMQFVHIIYFAKCMKFMHLILCHVGEQDLQECQERGKHPFFLENLQIKQRR